MNRALASFVFTGETLFNLKGPVAAEEAKPPVLPPRKNPEKRTLILVDFLPDADRELLTRIMASVGVTPDDIEVLHQQQFPEYDLQTLGRVEQVITFGDFSEVLQWTEKPVKYRLAAHAGKKILLADPLTMVGRNLAGEKRNLWAALKEMFGLS
ncbi:hypothetical protein [Leadbetterella sp. DM7]|uniref:hypothetical protein n=1 Tax=Leadbetterella sp. DM7 TaxID=3235085 RepID=UPI00349EE753